MGQFHLKSSSNLRSAQHFRYSIVIDSHLHSIFIFAQLSLNCTFYRIRTCFALLIAIYNISTVCDKSL